MRHRGIHLIRRRVIRTRSQTNVAMSHEGYMRLAKQLRAEKRGIYLLTRVEGSPMFRLQGPDNTDVYVDDLGAAFDALSKLNIMSVEITATEVR